METQQQLFEAMLLKNGHFLTKARRALFRVLQTAKPLSVGQIVAKLNAHDQASVYRNVKVFEELGIVKRIGWGNKSKLELSDLFQKHHHHLVCIECQSIMDLHDEAEIEFSIANVASHRGFLPLDHVLEIRGLCRSCQ